MTALRRFLLALAVIVCGIAALAAIGGVIVLRASRPVLEGRVRLAGLAAPASIARDAQGVPVITAASRRDLARATGFVHAQERFFQMDLLRRAGAGELSELVGPAALPLDRARRLHRFRARAARLLPRLPPDQRALLAAYADGVNAGLAALGHAPWEYTLLRQKPAPWRPEDSALVTFAMFFDLQDSDAETQLLHEKQRAQLGPALADFLYPRGTARDAPLDNSHFPEPPLPAGPPAPAPRHAALPADAVPADALAGSNNFAVSGAHTATGAALVESDMHLAIGVPDIWFRARLIQPGALDLVGVTLPGQPFVIVGSNTHVAWAFTDSYIETGDAVVIETDPADPQTYRTPDGPRRIETEVEHLCPARSPCQDLLIRDTIWGPITGRDAQGRPVAWHWMADDDQAVKLDGLLSLEHAQSVRQALDAAHQAGLPDQNFVTGDDAGHIAWTIIGQVPRRVGLTDQLPHSWADGATGWRGWLAPQEIPEVIDPPDGRLWSANARMLGGAGYDLLGDGGYGPATRAAAIRDDLFARERFGEADMLAIANETRADVLAPWQKLMLDTVARQPGGAVSPLAAQIRDWGGHAVPASAGYRLVREFRTEAILKIYAGLAAGVTDAEGDVAVSRQADGPALRLLQARPAGLVPPPYRSWDDLTGAVLKTLQARIAAAGGDPARYIWGARNTTAIHHPLARAVKLLGLLTDPPDEPVAGDALVPRVVTPGFGASERLIVSPGHEAQGLFNLPTSQSDNPLSPYYLAGHETWVRGAPAPLLPGPARWTVTLVP